jgi:four helix bundle protein
MAAPSLHYAYYSPGYRQGVLEAASSVLKTAMAKTALLIRVLHMTQIHSHRDLIVWQKTVRLSGMIVGLTERFPAEERFRLTACILRSAASVHAKLAKVKGGEPARTISTSSPSPSPLQETDSLLAGALACGWITRDRPELWQLPNLASYNQSDRQDRLSQIL